MELKTIDEKVYKEFALKNKYISIYQLPEWGTLKEITGWKRHLLGYYDNKKLLGVTLLLEKNTPIKKSLYYSPRGYLLDVFNYDLLKSFHYEIIKYIKKHNGFMLKVDPNVVYAIRNSNGEVLEITGKEALENFKKMGFKHYGFNKNFETLQPRFLCGFNLENTYEETLKHFSKNTRKNIEKTINLGVRVKKVGISEIDDFVSLLNETGNTKGFAVRPIKYYKRMYELMSDYINLYIAYIDTDEHYQFIQNELDKAKNELGDLEKEMSKINVGEKITKHHDTLKLKIIKLEEKLEEAKQLKEFGQSINIGALLSVFIGNEAITFLSGTTSKYRSFSPKYAFYNEHIKDAIQEKKEYINFYGISGDMDKNSPYYSIYEIKKGFNPNIVELIGEFDYIISKPVYCLYNVALFIYKIAKRITKK